MSARADTLDRQPRVVVPLKRGLNREEAAGYVGVGATKFDELVRDGRMPHPFRIDGRVIWDIRALDVAFEKLSGQPAEVNEWDSI